MMSKVEIIFVLVCITMIILSVVGLKLSNKQYEKYLMEIFKPGNKIKEYEVIGHVFIEEHLIREVEIVDYKNGYLLLQTNEGFKYEENLRYMIEFSDKLEVYDQGGNKIYVKYMDNENNNMCSRNY